MFYIALNTSPPQKALSRTKSTPLDQTTSVVRPVDYLIAGLTTRHTRTGGRCQLFRGPDDTERSIRTAVRYITVACVDEGTCAVTGPDDLDHGTMMGMNQIGFIKYSNNWTGGNLLSLILTGPEWGADFGEQLKAYDVMGGVERRLLL